METFDIITQTWVVTALGISHGNLRNLVNGNRFPFNRTRGSCLYKNIDTIIVNVITAWSIMCTEPFTATFLVNRSCEFSFNWDSSLLILRCSLEYCANSSFIEIFFWSAFSFSNSAHTLRSLFEGLLKHAATCNGAQMYDYKKKCTKQNPNLTIWF